MHVSWVRGGFKGLFMCQRWRSNRILQKRMMAQNLYMGHLNRSTKVIKNWVAWMNGRPQVRLAELVEEGIGSRNAEVGELDIYPR